MSIRLIRTESETPNIQNSEDIRALKYSTCGMNGIVKNYLNEVGYEISGNTFKVKTGEIIIDGWQVDIEGSGEEIEIDSTGELRYCSIYIEVNLSISDKKSASIKTTYSTVEYPDIAKGDDISVNKSGIARLELYRFTAQNGSLSEVQTMSKLIDGNRAYIAQYASEDTSKGTIEERLTRLGFKQGSIELNAAAVNTSYSSLINESANIIKRQGNYVLLSWHINIKNGFSIGGNHILLGTIPKNFVPSEKLNFNVLAKTDTTGITNNKYVEITISIDTEGNITEELGYVAQYGTTWAFESMKIDIGYEAAPL